MAELADEYIYHAASRNLNIFHLRQYWWLRTLSYDDGFGEGKHRADMVDLGTDVSGIGKRAQNKKELTRPIVPDVDRQDCVRFGSFEQARVPGRKPCIFGDRSGGVRGADPMGRKVGIGVAATKMIDGEWNMTAGTMAYLPGRRQTAPRAEFTAFAIAIEETVGDIAYVTDHYPLLNAWNKGKARDPGRDNNAGIWARIGRGITDNEQRHIEAEWTPSHQDDDEAEVVNPIFAVGNSFADALVAVAAEPSWEMVCQQLPRTDEWDAIRAHVRLRARQALADLADADPWCAERVDLLVGDTVEIFGLNGAKELNGRRGVIVTFVSDTQRFGVKLEGDEETKAVKPANLKRLEEYPNPNLTRDARQRCSLETELASVMERMKNPDLPHDEAASLKSDLSILVQKLRRIDEAAKEEA
ncbi:unnamed protein product, partial [Prorocentrum cordatum]